MLIRTIPELKLLKTFCLQEIAHARYRNSPLGVEKKPGSSDGAPGNHKFPKWKAFQWEDSFEEPFQHQSEIPDAKLDGSFRRKVAVPVKSAEKGANCSPFLDSGTQKFMKMFMKTGNSHVLMRQWNEISRHIKDIQLKRYYKAADENKDKIIVDPQLVLQQAIEMARPLMRIEETKVGGVIYQVPVPINEKFADFEARRWIKSAIRDRDTRGTRIGPTLAKLLVDTANGTGRVIATKNEHHKVCDLNRAYARYRRGI